MSTVSPLDPIADDLTALGLAWVDGVGFRPADGWEHVATQDQCTAIYAEANPEPEPLDPETIAARQDSYRRDMIDAGRGYLLGDRS